MDAVRWREVRKALDGALDRDGAERDAYVAAIEDEALRIDVLRLLSRQAETSPIDHPASSLAASALAGGHRERDWDREQIGRRIGPFVLDDLLGSGGMGTVYRAHRTDGRFEQTVAIKLVLTAHPGLRERFRKEQEILAGLHHPNIAQLIDGGEADDGTPFLAMEYIAGMQVTDWCRERLPDVASRLRLCLRIAGALSHAHRNLVIHRDLKPSNILVTEDGHPKLLDFGIAKLVGEDRFRPITAQRIGPMTPAYAAPEQFRGGTITVATDVYQFGVLLFRLITGRLPYDADSNDAIAWGRAVVESEPITLGRALAAVRRGGDGTTTREAVRTLPRDIHRDLDAIVRTALEKDPARRYGSIDALAADIEAFLDGRPVQARRGGTFYYANRFVRRHRVAVSIAAVAAIGLLALSGYALRQAQLARHEAERAGAAVEFIHAVFRAADPQHARGGRLAAEDLIEIAAGEVEPMLRAHPDVRGPLSALIAEAYFNLGTPRRAHALYRQAVTDLRATPATPPLELAQALERGAAAAQRDGATAQARAWADEAERLATGGSEDEFRIRDGIAFTRWLAARDAGRSAEALAEAERALAALERAPDSVRDDLRNRALNRVGTSLTDLRRFDEAGPLLRESLAIAQRLWGDAHPRTLRARQTLGWFLTSSGDPVRGLAELEPVGERIREVLGERSLDYGGNAYNRANAYRALGQLQRAVDGYEAAAAAFAASASPNAAQIGWALWNAGLVEASRGDHAAARGHYLATERAWQGSVADDAPARGHLYFHLATSSLALGDHVEAERYADRALAQWRRADPAASDIAPLLALSGQIAQARGDIPRAIVSYEDAAAHAERLDPPQRDEAAAWRREAQRLRAGVPAVGD